MAKNSSKKNIIKLAIDDRIQNDFYGNQQACEKLIKSGSNIFAEKLINGIIRINVSKYTETGKETTIKVKIFGEDNIQDQESISNSSLSYSNQFLSIKKEFEDISYITITNEGATLIFYIELEKSPKKKSNNQPQNLTGKKVLIAEDNEINAIVFSSFLEEWGCQCNFAINGLEALQMAQEGDYDFILMDIHMPVLNGIQATEKIREFNKTVPVIALTASDLEQDYNGAQLAGISDYLVKPISSQLLKTVILRCMSISEK
ncbi:response regulator [Marivirga arenosa]|uniref:Response regulator n=1 Tax=Marivirga arenosa TaxID=3059076 RepID=A0AA51ZXG8_9BACT|nr:response regulator [Marivirga sp. BKB1-2]WNB18585.1 response regulator [Marivirga sp. BKB1-2]